MSNLSDKERLRLAIAVMAYGGQICVQHARMWLELGAEIVLSGEHLALIQFQTLDVGQVDRARNMALAAALDAVPTQADWLLMIDADVFTSTADAIVRMILEANQEQLAIVAAPVRARGRDQEIMAYRIQENIDGECFVPIELDQATRGLVLVDAVAAAIMAVNLRRVGDAVFQFTAGTATQKGLSEDLAFCQQIRTAGGNIACDTRVITGHLARPQVIQSEQTPMAQRVDATLNRHADQP